MKALLFLVGLFFRIKSSHTTSCTYTYGDHTGNRVVQGTSTFPAATTFDLRHPGVLTGGKHVAPIQWVVGRQGTNSTVHWFATDTNNKIWSFEHRSSEQPRYKNVMESAMIPFLSEFSFDLPDDASPLSHPVCLPNQNLLYVSILGDVVLINKYGDQLARQKLNALPDARLVLNRNRTMVAFYIAATQPGGYVHGAIGDGIEGAAIGILRAENLEPIREIRLADESVIFEGISPMWVDFENDGNEEIVATVSNSKVGAAIFVFDVTGAVLARSTPIGQGSRWRHQLAVGKLGPSHLTELVDVHTPHSGQVVEFFVKDADKLRLVASRHGYTSHIYGSRNLDMAAVGDFDGDGKPELVLPSSSRYRIVGLRHSTEGFRQGYAKEMWEFWLGKKVTSNIAAVPLSGDRLGLGVGLEDGSLRIFLPRHM